MAMVFVENAHKGYWKNYLNIIMERLKALTGQNNIEGEPKSWWTLTNLKT